MPALDRKLLRDLRRLWAQALAIALVIAGGVATLILAVGSHRSLDATRSAYYERNRFADVFATVRRAPKSLGREISAIPGVAAADTRIAKLALVDIPGFAAPASAQVISLPDGEPLLNVPYLRSGRPPVAGKANEVVINESFATAHDFSAGSEFSAILNGRKLRLTVVGIALSPEFIYAIGPGDMMPDNSRFGIVWMPEATLAAIYDLKEAFSSVTVKLLPNASEREVIGRLDAVLAPYGGTTASGRKDQVSHAFLDHELDMLNNMSRVLAPIFLIVSAFLVNLTLSRTIELEREQVGLLKAVGYSDAAIAAHYIKFVVAVAIVGIIIGSLAGTWLGAYVTALFGEFFRFPFLIFVKSPDLYAIAALLSIAAAIVGAMRALWQVMVLSPAVAMAPPAPPQFHHLWNARRRRRLPVSQRTIMLLRNLAHHPVRALLTTLGLSLATAILVVSLFISDTMENLIDVTYFRADRQDAVIAFGERRQSAVVQHVAHLPGVLNAEPFRDVPVRIRKANVERRILLSGRPVDGELSQIIDTELQAVALPEGGLAISSWLAQILDAKPGDEVEIDILEGARRTISLPVATLVEDYFGIRGMMDAPTLARLMQEAPAVSSVYVKIDKADENAFFEAVKRTPIVSGLSLRASSLRTFRETVALLVNTMAGIYTTLAGVIAFGVVYNSARVSLSERARELASLRVLGFTRREVIVILLLELGLLTLLAQPPGWVVGYGLAWIMRTNLAGELMRVRLVVEPITYALASAIVIGAALASALVVRKRIDEFDLVAVLKTRD